MTFHSQKFLKLYCKTKQFVGAGAGWRGGGSIGFWMQGFTLVRHVLYCLSYASSKQNPKVTSLKIFSTIKRYASNFVILCKQTWFCQILFDFLPPFSSFLLISKKSQWMLRDCWMRNSILSLAFIHFRNSQPQNFCISSILLPFCLYWWVQ
jgi:hypothetical protein